MARRLITPRCVLLLLLSISAPLLPFSVAADSRLLLLQSSGGGSSSSSVSSIPTTDIQASYPANQDIIITITPPAGEVLKSPMTWTLYYVSTNQEVGNGVQTGSTINTIVGEGGSYRLHVDGFYESNNAWSMLLFFEGQYLPPTLASQTTYEEGDDVDILFTAPAGLSFKVNSLDCDVYDQQAEPRQRLGGTPANLFTDSWSHVAGTPAVLWYECSGEYTDDSPWSLFFPLETVAVSASAPPPVAFTPPAGNVATAMQGYYTEPPAEVEQGATHDTWYCPPDGLMFTKLTFTREGANSGSIGDGSTAFAGCWNGQMRPTEAGAISETAELCYDNGQCETVSWSATAPLTAEQEQQQAHDTQVAVTAVAVAETVAVESGITTASLDAQTDAQYVAFLEQRRAAWDALAQSWCGFDPNGAECNVASENESVWHYAREAENACQAGIQAGCNDNDCVINGMVLLAQQNQGKQLAEYAILGDPNVVC